MITDLQLRRLKAAASSDETRSFPDENFYVIRKAGESTVKFQQKYTYMRKQRMAYLGSYPSTSLAEARARARQNREWLDAGQDPKAMRKTLELTGSPGDLSFNSVCVEWFDTEFKQNANVQKYIARV